MYELSLLKQLINYFFEQDPENPKCYSIKKERIIKFYSESLLRSTLKMNYNEFILILRKTLPSEFSLDFKVEYIQSICYVEEPYIYYFNVMDLPDNIEKRLRLLFEKRVKWPANEIAVFIADLCNNNATDISNALTKYCRPYTHNNIKYYTTRM